MGFKMTYDKRNRDNIAKLADNTKAKTLVLYQYCIDNEIDILIYETIRTLETQRENVRKGVSQTLKSYHLVGQAFDFVLVVGGQVKWNGYDSPDAKKVYAKAKQIGFECGKFWTSFVDAPHLQYNFKGYGTDTFGKKPVKAKVSSVAKKVAAKVTGKKYYIVVSGDSLSKIALKNNTTIEAIKNLNKLNSDVIQINQKLRVK